MAITFNFYIVVNWSYL